MSSLRVRLARLAHLRPGRRAAPGGGPRDISEAGLRRRIVGQGGSLSPGRPGQEWRAWRNRALRSAGEVEAAVAAVRGLGLVPHPDAPKNWDLLVALGAILERTTPDARVLEMGAARYSPLLVWLYQYGYRALDGIDLTYERPLRRGPILLQGMDLEATAFEDGSFDAVACLSVIEHGVDEERYLREARRLLRPGGVLVTSTDYWIAPLDTAGREAYGHPVRVFDGPAIESFLAAAERLGFTMDGPVDLACEERVVHWARVGLDYTFLVLVHTSGARVPAPDPASAEPVAR